MCGLTLKTTDNCKRKGNESIIGNGCCLWVCIGHRSAGANSVPEPATLALVCLGLLGISVTCRRKVNSYQRFINSVSRT
ncbi:MAG: PEP-CTERM sorting domain-containing protein [Nitrosospira sp.]|nr:PEP-CTERM sorting domain-containing protein [Nitrosospira sp.]